MGADQIILAGLAEEIRAPDIADDAAVAVIDHDDGDVCTVGKISRRFEGQALKTALDAALDEGAHRGPGPGVGRQRHRQMRREKRQGLTGLGHRTVGRLAVLDGGEGATRGQNVDYPVAGVAGYGGAQIGAAALRRLRQGHQQGCFRRGQGARFLAKVGQGRRPHALQIAAIGRQRQVQGENFVLREAQLELQRAQGFDHLAAEIARMRLQQPCRLHGQRRGARNHLAAGQELGGCAQDRQRIDAGMPAEAAILVGDQQAQEQWIDVARLRQQSPAIVAGSEGAQHFAVGIDH